MDFRIPSDELGDFRCSDFDMPLISPGDIELLLTFYFSNLTNEQWEYLAADTPDTDAVILLSDMCEEILDMLSAFLLEETQVQSWKPVPPPQRNVHTVTEEDILSSIGNSFHHCFGYAMGVQQERSDDSEKLEDLFAAELTKRVNRSLAVIRTTTSSTQSDECAEKDASIACQTDEMVFYMINIMQCLLRKDPEKSPSSPDNMMEVEEEEEDDIEFQSVSERSASCSEDFRLRDETFVFAFLWKLLDHIAHSTKTSIFDVDCDGLLECLITRCVGELSSTLPQSVGNLHLLIYKDLCRQFGSAELLQAAMVSGHEEFGEAVARTLKVELLKSAKKRPSFLTKVRRFFSRRRGAVAPACAINSENLNSENGLTPTPQRTPKRPAIMRMLFCCQDSEEAILVNEVTDGRE